MPLSKNECCCFAVKKRLSSEGMEVYLKAYVKYKNIGSDTKSLNGISIKRTLFTILARE
jgi:hypothetical protein